MFALSVVYAGNNIYKNGSRPINYHLPEKAKITYTADKNNDPYKYCDKITCIQYQKNIVLLDVTCTEVDADGQPVRDKQLPLV